MQNLVNQAVNPSQVALYQSLSPSQRVNSQMLGQAEWVNSVDSTNEVTEQPTTPALVNHSDYHPTF